jgi:tetratricopeptide (TPR) repeat protein
LPEQVSEGVAAPDQAPDPTVDSGTDYAQTGISAFLIVVIGFLVYLNAFGIPLHGEDEALFVDSTALHRVVTFTDAPKELKGAPLTAFGFALNWSLLPGATGLHGVNLFLHLFNGVLLYFLCRKLLRKKMPEPVSMAAGLLFVLHPLTTESVHCLAARPMLQSTTFILLSLLLTLHAARRPERVAPLTLAMSMGCYVLACGSAMPAFLIVPPVMVLLLSACHGFTVFRKQPLLYFVPCGTFGILLVALIASGNITSPSLGRIANFPALAGLLVGTTFYPTSLCSTGYADLPVVYSGVGLLLLAGTGAVLLWKRGQSPLVAALAWAVVALFFTAVLAGDEQQLTDRMLYLPLAGLLIVLPWLFEQASRPPVKTTLGILTALIILVSAFLSYQRTGLWASPEALWRDAAQKRAESPIAFRHLGTYLVQQARNSTDDEGRSRWLAQAEGPLQEALDRGPDHVATLTSLGVVRQQLAKSKDALAVLQRALRLDPFNKQATLYTALSLGSLEQGNEENLRKSLDYFERARALGALDEDSTIQFALLKAYFGDFEIALQLLQPSIQADPNSPLSREADRFQGFINNLQGRQQQIQKSFAEDPNGTQGRLILAETQLLRRQELRAYYGLERVLSAAPDNLQAWTLMGLTKSRMKDPQGFVNQWGEAFLSRSDAWKNLAKLCASQFGDWQSGLFYLHVAARDGQQAHWPLMTLADIAMELKNPAQARAALQQVTETYPHLPDPWLKMCDIALSGQDLKNAGAFLLKAEERGASLEAIQSRREKIGGSAEPFKPVRTIIR